MAFRLKSLIKSVLIRPPLRPTAAAVLVRLSVYLESPLFLFVFFFILFCLFFFFQYFWKGEKNEIRIESHHSKMMERWVAFRLIRARARNSSVTESTRGGRLMAVTKTFFFFLVCASFLVTQHKNEKEETTVWSSSLTDNGQEPLTTLPIQNNTWK